MLNEEELKDAALLVFANKQDQPGAKGAGDISEALQLGELRDRNWSIMACSAVDGRGVNEGMDWLVVRVQNSVFMVFELTLHSKLYRMKHRRFSLHRDTPYWNCIYFSTLPASTLDFTLWPYLCDHSAVFFSEKAFIPESILEQTLHI